MSGPGFIFWGLLLACALTIGGYGLWIVWIERRASRVDNPGRAKDV